MSKGTFEEKGVPTGWQPAPKLHGHAQIQYKDGAVESLVGFDPVKDRQVLHDMLDEFLNEHVVPAVNGTLPGGTLPEDEPLSFTSNHFIVFGNVD